MIIVNKYCLHKYIENTNTANKISDELREIYTNVIDRRKICLYK